MNPLLGALSLVMVLGAVACTASETPIVKAPVDVTCIPLTFDGTVSLTRVHAAGASDSDCDRAIDAKRMVIANQVGRALRQAGFHMRSSLRNPGDLAVRVAGRASCGGSPDSDEVEVTLSLSLSIEAGATLLAMADVAVHDDAGAEPVIELVNAVATGPALIAFARSPFRGARTPPEMAASNSR